MIPAAFDYVAWYADDWVYHTRDEPAAIALRTRLAKAIAWLARNPEGARRARDLTSRSWESVIGTPPSIGSGTGSGAGPSMCLRAAARSVSNA